MVHIDEWGDTRLSRRDFLSCASAIGVALLDPRSTISMATRAATSGPSPSSTWRGVLTQHNDNFRTGSNLHETTLTPAALESGRFGRLCTRAVDADIYAQPLFVPDVTIRGRGRCNALYIATMANSIYVFDADTISIGGQAGLLLYRRLPLSPFRVPVHADSRGVSNFQSGSSVGILSTPAIDPERNLIYLVAMSQSSAFRVDFWLHALDLSTLRTVLGPVRIHPTVKGSGPGTNNGVLHFLPRYHLQRPALLLANGAVYVAFGSYGDAGYYHGWVLAFEADSLRERAVFNTTPFAGRGGIWQSGQGLAADPSGNVYAVSGNSVRNFLPGPVRCSPSEHLHQGFKSGVRPVSGRDLGNSVIKLSPNLDLIDWFTPSTFMHDNDCDLDLGSGGPLVVPDMQRVIGGGKPGTLFVLDTSGQATMGGFASSIHGGLQHFRAVGRLEYGFQEWTAVCGFPPGGRHHIHGSPVYWDVGTEAYAYVWSENDWLRAFRFSKVAGLFVDATGVPLQGESATPWRLSAMDVTSCASTTDPMTGKTRAAMPGAVLSLSASGTQPGTGILWATHPAHYDATYADVSGRLRAFDASTLRLLWDSASQSQPFGKFAKFCPVTVAGGRVYVPTASRYVAIYGMQ